MFGAGNDVRHADTGVTRHTRHSPFLHNNLFAEGREASRSQGSQCNSRSQAGTRCNMECTANDSSDQFLSLLFAQPSSRRTPNEIPDHSLSPRRSKSQAWDGNNRVFACLVSLSATDYTQSSRRLDWKSLLGAVNSRTRDFTATGRLGVCSATGVPLSLPSDSGTPFCVLVERK